MLAIFQLIIIVCDGLPLQSEADKSHCQGLKSQLRDSEVSGL